MRYSHVITKRAARGEERKDKDSGYKGRERTTHSEPIVCQLLHSALATIKREQAILAVAMFS